MLYINRKSSSIEDISIEVCSVRPYSPIQTKFDTKIFIHIVSIFNSMRKFENLHLKAKHIKINTKENIT